MQLFGKSGVDLDGIINRVRNDPMKTNLILIASAAYLALTIGVAYAADTTAPNAQSEPGATIGTPGAESKGNPIPTPDTTSGTSVDQGSASATATTPGEESKGKPNVSQ